MKTIKFNQDEIKKSRFSKKDKGLPRHGGKRSGAGRKQGTKVVALPPVRPEIKAELRELAREYCGAALDALVKVCTTGQSESARVSAAEALLDRGYGKPSQHVDVQVTHYDGMDEDQLRDAIEAQMEVIQLLEHGGTEH